SARKVRLAAMLVHEAFEFKLHKGVVVSRPCIYGVFGGRLGGFKPLECKCGGCMRCVQEYPHIMTVKQSDEYKRLGDSFWTPEAVFTIWNEASTGKIPVKGMGYKGAFGGEGFDGIWTDMSEIVRPTRDGVYGREYISTCVDIGRKPTKVDFSKLAREGVHGLHLYADYHGQDYSKDPLHLSASLKEAHQQLVKEGLRDQVTIIASGGITLAEHVPKTIICGADLVGIDTSVLVALQA